MKRLAGLLVALLALLASCGGGGGTDDGSAALAATSTPPPRATPTPPELVPISEAADEIVESLVRDDARYFLTNPELRELICPPIRGLPELEAGEIVTRLASVDDASDAALAIFGRVYLEECERITGD